MRQLVTENETIKIAEEAMRGTGIITVTPKGEGTAIVADGNLIGIYLPSEPHTLSYNVEPVKGCRVALLLGNEDYISAPVTDTSGWDAVTYGRMLT